MSNWIQTGLSLAESKKAIILLHGRGASAESILSLTSYLDLADFSVFAPQAAQRTWYPYGFMASDEGNLSALNSSLRQVSLLVQFLNENGKAPEQIYVMGFSQGACLSLEFTARNAQKFGGVIAFTGGLIGENLEEEKYKGDFQGTPILLSGSAHDMHVPAQRIHDSAQLLQKMGAEVSLSLFEDELHTIRPEELTWVNQQLFL
jgi:phospholipase/carboxylesterase|uniref:alpha/beta hydrolase n=1 Tax=Algoriphagus sp. TaxID=1872435 RepID=UPI00404790CF